ncbi:hypothetical protein E1218_00330 [Kribbella turkmenica]|uniref:Uncharacterized protein n=1 Tax=Kribbella turkmenica TaxID=2530375 RepID=A0A4R4XIT1_9ACTN|nr:hypothetical protein [Kribbella turkmenica]TDD30796.1 hypothetical protein E1218_00330 [Kribbella turkmenica]
MPLRDLPTESKAAAALLRTDLITHRRTIRRSGRHCGVLACLAAGTAFAVLLPGSPGTGCYLWRASTQPITGRGAALAVPVAIVLLVLADRLSADRFRLHRLVRSLGTAAVALTTVAAWTGFAAQGRPSCATSPTVIGTLVFGTLATGVAAHWATRSTAPWTVPEDGPGDGSAEPLNQSELRAVFVQLGDEVDAWTPFRFRGFAFASGALAVLLALSTALPWRELLDPVALGPTASEAGLARSQLWEIPSARIWAYLVCGAAVATLVSSGLVRRAAAVATGSVVIAGLLAHLLWLPPRLASGVGYRPAIGAWIALGLGLLLLVAGLWGARRAVVTGAAVLGAVAGVLVPSATGAPYRPPVEAGVPHRLLDLHGGQLVDRLGMRVGIGTPDPLDSVAGMLDGSPGQWLLGRTGSESSTVFAYDDGVALPQVTLNHGPPPPALWGVTDDRMILLAGGALGRPWAILSVPLDLVSADISLSHENQDGSYYVTPGVDVLATGHGTALGHRNADRSIVVRGSTTTWRIPANQLRKGMRLADFVVDPGPGAPGNAVSTGPDGTTVWRTSETGVAMVRPGGEPRQLAGVAPAGCVLSSDAASSSMTIDAFAVDLHGNVWLGGGAPTSVITPDGVLRKLPGGADGVKSIEARPDGSVLLGTSPGGGNQILRIPDAAAAAASYPAAPEPTPRCDRRRPADGLTSYRTSVLPPVPVVDPKPGAAGVSTQLALDAAGQLVRVRVPLTARAFAPDGQGGVWWTVAGRSGESAAHLSAGVTTVVRDPRPLPPNQEGEHAAAAGDRLVTAVGAGAYNFYGPGGAVRRVHVKGDLRELVQLPSGQAAMVIGERLVQAAGDGRTRVLLGGSASGWPISATGVPAAERTADGSWFTGPDGTLWGYDGSHLVRVDAPGRITVIAGPRQGVPQAADQVTVIRQALYFRLGNDLVRLEPAG